MIVADVVSCGLLASPTNTVCAPLPSVNPPTITEPGDVVTGFGVTDAPAEATLNGGVPPEMMNENV